MPRRFLLLLVLLSAWASFALAAEGDKLFFSRDFPGSVPEYFNVTVLADGKVVYRESPDDELPIEFQAPESDISRLFEISEKLGHFKQPFAPPKRETAFTGDKVLRYSDAAGETNEVKFVLVDDEQAKELVSWFLHVAETEWHVINIEKAVQFDRLGVNKAILQFQVAFDKGRVIAPKQFLPLLKNISKDMKIVHLARSRAAGIAERIEAADASKE